MKEPLIVAPEFQYLEKIIKQVEDDKSWLNRVVCFMMYYNQTPTRTNIKRAILELFQADAYRQRQWLQHPSNKKIKTFEEIDEFLNEERFREYDAKAIEVVNKKYKSKFKNTMPLYDWAQSTFCPNCPIYYVEKGRGMLMKIEYDIEGKTDRWVIQVLNGFAKIVVDGTMNESDKIKAIAEQELRKTLKSLI